MHHGIVRYLAAGHEYATSFGLRCILAPEWGFKVSFYLLLHLYTHYQQLYRQVLLLSGASMQRRPVLRGTSATLTGIKLCIFTASMGYEIKLLLVIEFVLTAHGSLKVLFC